MKKEKIIKIATEYGDKTATQLAEELGCSVPYIFIILKKLRNAGVRVERKTKTNSFEEAVKELKK